MMSDAAATNYIRDLGDLVKRSGLEARAQRDASSIELDQAFENGRLAAYHEMVSLMQQQAIAFGIELADVALHDVDPDRDLL